MWEDVDNPGKWLQYTYRPTFKGDGTYQYHEMPSRATPVPINSKTGKQTMNDWGFFYDGWDHPDPNKSNTQGGTRNDLFPPNCDVLLDPNMLRKLGMRVEICPNMDPHGRGDYHGLFGDNRTAQGDAEDTELIEAYEVPRR